MNVTVHVPEDDLRDLARALKFEWLETNGLGGYAMGTAAGANTRRYHGLLCAALRPPTDRRMVLNKLEDWARIDSAEYALSCNLYGDVVHPEGHLLLKEFRKDPWPLWTYQAGPAVIEKAVFMPYRWNAAVIAYRCVAADRPIAVRARPLMSCRQHHYLGSACVEFHVAAEPLPDGVRLLREEWPPITLQLGDGRFWPATQWYYGFTYPEEAARGLDFTEDLYSPGEIEWIVRPGETVGLVVSVGPVPQMSIAEAMAAERARREALLATAPAQDQVARLLFLAADQFLVARPAPDEDWRTTPVRSVIAGYPWFTDWGRDTMIALPGLLLTTGRHAEARAVLETYAGAMQDGLLPNVFPDHDTEAAFNTVDATLWLFVAARRYLDASGDLNLFAGGLFERLEAAVSAYMEGTRYGIRMDGDGLIEAGEPGTQLTWMDVKLGDWVVTPRHGKAVEINALWYSALRTMEYLARKLDREQSAYARQARLVKDSFVATFWDENLGYLYDCVRGEEKDASLRPNQIIACALPYSPLSVEQERSILRVVTERLLTPFGLRTLAPGHPDYRGRCEGEQWARDSAYHQGTVWPWLLGPFLSAFFVHSSRSEDSRRWVRELVEPLIAHLHRAGLGQVSEIFDGDWPHEPRGCPAQAWSVAELLRVWVENKLGEL